MLGHSDVVGAPYSCDAPKMTAAGIPTIVFGVGDIAQAHARDEYVEIDQLVAAVDVLSRSLERLAKRKTSSGKTRGQPDKVVAKQEGSSQT